MVGFNDIEMGESMADLSRFGGGKSVPLTLRVRYRGSLAFVWHVAVAPTPDETLSAELNVERQRDFARRKTWSVSDT